MLHILKPLVESSRSQCLKRLCEESFHKLYGLILLLFYLGPNCLFDKLLTVPTLVSWQNTTAIISHSKALGVIYFLRYFDRAVGRRSG